MIYDVSIVGAGASGMVLAIALARENKSVVLFEKNSKVGKRLLATGNGRCNITNLNISLDKFYSKNRKFLRDSILDYKKIEKFFNSIGLYFTSLPDGRVFPMSLQALSVVELLEYELKRLGVEIVYFEVEKIKKQGDIFQLYYNNSNNLLESRIVVIATGNIANPKLGASRSGLDFAEFFGHRLTPLYPSLVQLTSNMKNLKKVSGVRVDANISFRDISIRGDILFTKYGISGLGILDISPFLVEILTKRRELVLEIDLMPDISERELFKMLFSSIKEQSRKSLDIWLMGFLNRKLIDFILDIDISRDIKSLSKRDITYIVSSIKSLKFLVNGTKGFEFAEVVRGGVDTRDIDSLTMESKLVDGLYFVGEVLDVDGIRGGYNLHFAWSSALRAKEGILCSIR